jgi:maltose O-acetyltransferase
MSGRLATVLRDEIGGVEPRAILARAVVAPFPRGGFSRTRAALLRRLGLSIGPGTILTSNVVVIGGRGSWQNVTIGADCFINQDCVLDATARITIGDHVNFGHGVLVTTSRHLVGLSDRRAGRLDPASVTIGDGAWLASRVVVLPGVEIGPGAIVGAGAVVTRSIPAHTLVGGVPAREIKRLE